MADQQVIEEIPPTDATMVRLAPTGQELERLAQEAVWRRAEAHEAWLKARGQISKRQTVWVKSAKEGQRVHDHKGGLYPEGAFEADRNDVYIFRRIRDGSLVLAQAPNVTQTQPETPAQPSGTSEPQTSGK
jgi:hypothetical protein